MGKEPACNAGDARDIGSIPGLGRSPGGGHGNPLQCSCLENPRNGGAWWAAVYGVTQHHFKLLLGYLYEGQGVSNQFLGLEDPLEEGTATLSSILAWKLSWTEDPGGPQFIGCKELDTIE